MKILNAEFTTGNKRANYTGGLYIDILSEDNVIIGDLFKMYYNDKSHYFSAINIETEGEYLAVILKEIGYYIDLFKHKYDVDLRNIIGYELTPVTNEDEIKIHEHFLFAIRNKI